MTRPTKPETFLFSAQIDGETSNKFNDIAADRGQSKAQVLRDWINRAHKSLTNGKAGKAA